MMELWVYQYSNITHEFVQEHVLRIIIIAFQNGEGGGEGGDRELSMSMHLMAAVLILLFMQKYIHLKATH